MESAIDKKTIETIKLLGKQLLEMRDVIEEQAKTIAVLNEEISRVKKKQTEQKGDIEMVVIDQRDVAKQLRMLKASVTGEMLVNSRMHNQDQAQNLAAIYPQTNAQDQSTEAVAKRFYSNYDQSQLFNQNQQQAYMPAQAVYQEQMMPQQNYQRPMPAAAQAQKPAIDHGRHAEHVAKEFIFGRIPKLLNLE